jgi:hypothetical protein
MAEQTEAQRLAELLDTDGWPDAAVELRRQEAVNKQLLEALEFPATLDVAGADDRAKALILDVVIWKARAAIAAAKGEV